MTFWKETGLINDATDELRLEVLQRLQQKPPLHTPGEKLFWNDPHIATQMLEAHLNPHTDAASRKPATIDRTVEWLIGALELQEGSQILDLGCGPGLYTSRFAQQGLAVTGMDFSENSLNYARNQADQEGLDIEYIYQDYLTMDFEEAFEAITLIFCDLGPLSNNDRDELLARVYRALKPGGQFAFDVLTRRGRELSRSKVGWSVRDSGFWSSEPHMVLTSVFTYPDDDVELDQHVVIAQDGTIKVYRLWPHFYSPETIKPILERHGFVVESIHGSLTGEPLTEESETLGVVVSKPAN